MPGSHCTGCGSQEHVTTNCDYRPDFVSMKLSTEEQLSFWERMGLWMDGTLDEMPEVEQCKK